MLTAAAATIAIAHHPALTAHSFSTIHGSGMLPPVAARNRCSFYTAVIACVSRLWHVASSCCIAFIAHICYAGLTAAIASHGSSLRRQHPIRARGRDRISRQLTAATPSDQGSRPGSLLRRHLIRARWITAATPSEQGSRPRSVLRLRLNSSRT